MASQLTNYQCPSCTGPLHFVGASGKLECDYCGQSFDIAEIEALYAEKEKKAADGVEADGMEADGDWDTSGFSNDWGADAEGMMAYSCPSCGAELICDASTAAASCPYCGNPTVVPGQFSGTLKPDYILHFKLSREDAIRKLKEHYRGKPFLPKSFTSANHIQEIRGVYVPFWLFDGEAVGNAVFEATRTRTFCRGDEEITGTSHFDVYRAGSVAFEKVPVGRSQQDAGRPYGFHRAL